MCSALGTVWLAAAGADLATVDNAQLDRIAGAGGAGAFDVQAAAGMLPGAETVTFAASTGTFARQCNLARTWQAHCGKSLIDVAPSVPFCLSKSLLL